MRLINEKGRLFGIINIVDLFFILVIVLGVGGVSWKLVGDAVSDKVAPQTEMITIMRIRGAAPTILDEIARNPLVGKKLVSGNDYVDATITDMSIEPFVIQTTTADGTIVEATDPVKKDIVITVKSTVAKNTATLKIGNQEVRAGRQFLLKTRDFEVYASIDSVITE